MPTENRLAIEARILCKQGAQYEQVFLAPSDTDPLLWNGTFYGPAGTPYEGGVFHLTCKLPLEYPFKPPEFQFITPVFHPGVVADSGTVLLDMLSSEWESKYTMHRVMVAILEMLKTPDWDSPHVAECYNLCRTDSRLFERRAREMTEKYAMGGYQLSNEGKPVWYGEENM